MMDVPRTRVIPLARPLDLRLTLAPTRIGRGDPCTKLKSDEAFHASRTPEGPATLHLLVDGQELRAAAWGDGADWALDQVPELVGQGDDPVFQTSDPLITDLQARIPGLRVGATRRVLEAIVPAVCAQRVSPFEAKRAYRQLVEALSEPAPGGPGVDLLLPPDARTLASTGYHDLHPLGLERSRADVVRRAAARAATVESVVDDPAEVAEARLRSIAGLGVWTSARVREAALGDPDAVPVGDAALKHLVSFVFTGERRGTDAQMIELLEPFRGNRGRVLRLLKAAGLGPPRHDLASTTG
ncbi:DNA-3-methyladenine glycosylase family protein [Actinospongicola halichondriae]|uniref:DNA-3-methyladenine glycosylase family protein n=1 Tax=Actinospongicola halichondriae TaxID=3236844 RepID=UPI003D3B590A